MAREVRVVAVQVRVLHAELVLQALRAHVRLVQQPHLRTAAVEGRTSREREHFRTP